MIVSSPPPPFSVDALQSVAQRANAGDEINVLRILEDWREQLPVEHPERAELLLALARLYPRLGRPSDAVRAGLEALFNLEFGGPIDAVCDAHVALALAYAQVGVGRESLDHALQALELARGLHDGEREAWALARVGHAHSALENTVQAREAVRQALNLACSQGLVELELTCRNHLAYFALDEVDRLQFDGLDDQLARVQALAQQHAEEAVERAREVGMPFMLGMALSNSNEALLGVGETTLAALRIEELTELALRQGFTTLQRFARLQRALLACRRGQWSDGVSEARRLLDEEGEQLLPRQRRVALQLLYEAHKALGDAAAALACLEQLVQLDRRSAREGQLRHTQVLLIRDEVQQAVRRAEYAAADADAAREETRAMQQDHQALREQLAETDRAAREDALTSLANRRHAEQVLQQLCDASAAEHRPLALALLDIDHFKRVNDGHGHATGDAVIQHLAQLLRQHLREADLLARWGGEEFLLAIAGVPAAACERLLQRLCDAVRHTDWTPLGSGLAVTVSIGCRHQVSGGDWAAQLAEADAALYAAKNGGRDRVVFTPR